MLRFIHFLLFFILFLEIASAQKVKTQYFNDYWIRPDRKKDIKYYRHIQKTRDTTNTKIYSVKDFYSTDTLQMEGAYLDPDGILKHGKFVYYYPSGKKKAEGIYIKNKKQGEYTTYYENGAISSIAVFRNDTLMQEKEFYEDHTIAVSASFKEEELDGEFYSFYPNGKPVRIDSFDKGVLITGRCFTSSGADTAYFPYAIQPVFPAGEKAFIDYMRKGIQAKNVSCGWFRGALALEIDVDVDGSLVDPDLIYTSDNCYLNKIDDLLKAAPHWVPGKADGLVTKASVYIEITFPE